MSEPGTFFIDDELEPQNSGTSLIDTDETPEETFFRTLAGNLGESINFYDVERQGKLPSHISLSFNLTAEGFGQP